MIYKCLKIEVDGVSIITMHIATTTSAIGAGGNNNLSSNLFTLSKKEINQELSHHASY